MRDTANSIAPWLTSRSYDRTPPCSEITIITQCSQFFHDVQLTNLKSFTKYYYKIEASNGTTASRILDFTTARAAGDDGPFTVAVLNDMGYTNAQGTHAQLSAAANKDVAFAWHGGDISYADDWYTGVLPCEEGYSCYNGSSSHLPPGDFPSDYLKPLPKGEIANQGSPRGGDISVIYESNWDLWQQWMNKVTLKMPYLTMPGNHEAACAEFDGPGNILTAYLNDDKANSTAPKQELTYYSCPPSQRNFTAYQNRFRMPGAESGGVGNMWYSFDYGMVHFIALNGETDFAYSPESPFLRDLKGKEALPTENETYITDSGPFGYIENNEWKNNQAYEQIQWLSKDLAAVNREKTPWIIAMSHRPMYSSETASYQKNVRAAFEPLFLKHGVDAYLAGHIHWYERLFPLGNGTINEAAIVNNNTYLTAPGKSIAHIVNGMAGNIESHSTLEESKVLNITAVLDQMHYGFSKLRVESAEQITFEFVRGDGEGIGDHLTLVKAGSAAAKKLSAGERDLR